MFVGQAMNAAHQNVGLPFDLSIRMRLVDKIRQECEKMGEKCYGQILLTLEDPQGIIWMGAKPRN